MPASRLSPRARATSVTGPAAALVARLLDGLGVRHGVLRPREEVGDLALRTTTFQAGRTAYALRMAHPARVALLEREAWALTYLVDVDGVPRLVAQGTDPAPHHLLAQPTGTPLALPLSTSDAAAVGELLGRLHAETGVAVRRRAPASCPTSLLGTFQQATDDVKAYLARRDADGQPQDMLTMTLLDLTRALRPYVSAAEHHFLPPPARVLCHGGVEPARLTRQANGRLLLRGWERAHAGDGAADLAQLCEQALLGEEATLALVEAYEEARGWRDVRLIPRLCALRVLLRLRGAAQALRGLYDLADLVQDGSDGPLEALRAAQEATRGHMLAALNGLSDFTGPARPLAPRDVEALGALMAVEELQLRGRRPVIVIEGDSYVGKTPLGQDLARRLRVPWVGVAAVLRAATRTLAPGEGVTPAALAQALRGLTWRVEENRLHVEDAGQLVGVSARLPGDVVVPDDVAAAPEVREALRQVLDRLGADGAVVEGARWPGTTPSRAHRVLLWASRSVRAARRQAHLESLGGTGVTPAPWAGDANPDEPPAPEPGQLVLDGSHRSVPQQARWVLRALLPAVGEDGGMTGRPVLFA